MEHWQHEGHGSGYRRSHETKRGSASSCAYLNLPSLAALVCRATCPAPPPAGYWRVASQVSVQDTAQGVDIKAHWTLTSCLCLFACSFVHTNARCGVLPVNLSSSVFLWPVAGPARGISAPLCFCKRDHSHSFIQPPSRVSAHYSTRLTCTLLCGWLSHHTLYN